jgi:Domain of unknown function (DUF4333)
VLPASSGPSFPFGTRIFVPIALLIALVALVGCGTVVDKVKLQDTVQASLEDSIHEKIKKVECPSDQSVDPGTTFTCDVVFSDDRREVAILKIRNKDADITMVGLKPEN